MTEQVRRRPYSVVLLDEIEKAHPDVFNVLLQILEDGRLTDGKGRTVDFRNAVIIMTSNVGSTAIFELSEKDPKKARELAMGALRELFRPEFLNRIDDIVMFRPLGKEQIERIVDLQMQHVMKLLAARQITLKLTPGGEDAVVPRGLRSRVWRASDEEGNPEADPGPARAQDPGRRGRPRRRSDGRGRSEADEAMRFEREKRERGSWQLKEQYRDKNNENS